MLIHSAPIPTPLSRVFDSAALLPADSAAPDSLERAFVRAQQALSEGAGRDGMGIVRTLIAAEGRAIHAPGGAFASDPPASAWRPASTPRWA
jgi:hypothetical protein